MRGYEEGGARFHIDGPIARITLDRPHQSNAQNPAMWGAVTRFLEALGDDVGVVIVSGAGRGFSAGIDLALVDSEQPDPHRSLIARARHSPEQTLRAIETYQRPFALLAEQRFISIAAVSGYAIGAGFQLALACDLMLVDESAWFCMKETALGLIPDLGGTKRLVDAVGYARALEICATARRVSAVEALGLGLAQELVPVGQLDEAARATAAALTANDRAAVRSLKGLLQAAPRRTFEEQRAAERGAQVERLRAVR